jgi:hypothetical protein
MPRPAGPGGAFSRLANWDCAPDEIFTDAHLPSQSHPLCSEA